MARFTPSSQCRRISPKNPAIARSSFGTTPRNPAPPTVKPAAPTAKVWTNPPNFPQQIDVFPPGWPPVAYRHMVLRRDKVEKLFSILSRTRQVAENHHRRAKRNFLKPFSECHNWTYPQHTPRRSLVLVLHRTEQLNRSWLLSSNGISSSLVGASHKAVGVGTMPDLRKHFSTACCPSKPLLLKSLARKPRL